MFGGLYECSQYSARHEYSGKLIKAPQRIEAAGKDSSFEKALKKAKDETAPLDEVSSDQNAAKAEQADL